MHARGIGERAADLVVAVEIADHPAAAMEVDQCRLRPCLAARPGRDRAAAGSGRPARGLQRDDLGDLLGIGLQHAPARRR